ncbi:MAG: response regulator [Melioribacteraceae bacterium]
MRILIVDGSERVRRALIRFLDLEKIFDAVFEAGTVEEAKRIMQSIKVEVVILDIQLSDQSGLDLVTFCDSQYHKPMLIVCSNYGMQQYKNIYEKLSIKYFFDKSSDLMKLKKFFKKKCFGNEEMITGNLCIKEI